MTFMFYRIPHIRNSVYCLLVLAAFARMNPAMACDEAPPAIMTIEANAYYIDDAYSVIDENLLAKNLESVKPLEVFLADVIRLSDRYLQEPTQNKHDAQCALNWLFSWAHAGAMLGKMSTDQAYFQQKWMLSGLALSYAKIQAEASPSQARVIEEWLKSLADVTLAHSDQFVGVRNNHYYWEGLAVTAVGAITNDDKYLQWGTKVFNHAMGQIQHDGSLPEELKRKRMARHYHLFAAAPLAMMASILDMNSSRFDALVQFCIRTLLQPEEIERQTGIKQAPLRAASTAWLAVYSRHNIEFQSIKFLRSHEPLFDLRMGGRLDVVNPLE